MTKTRSLLVALAVLACACIDVQPVAAQALNPQVQPTRQFYVATHFRRGPKLPSWDVDRLIPLIKQLGVEGVRDDVSWSGVEKVKGQFEIGAADRHWLDATRAAGLKVILLLDYGNKIYENNLDPDAFARYAAFMAKEARAYPNVVAMEIWNEPNNFFFQKQYGGLWNGKDDAAWIGKFAELVEKSAAAIRKENPNVKIITGAGVTPATYYLISKHPQAWKNIDGVTDHPYNYRLPPEVATWGGPKNLERDGISVADDKHSMTSALTGYAGFTKEKLGRELPVWVTEFGIATFVKQKKGALYNGYTDTAQAAYHARALIQGLASNAAVWTIYDLVEDGEDSGDAEHNFGLLRFGTAEPKPAFQAISRTAGLLGPDWKQLDKDAGALEVINKALGDKHKDEWANPTPDEYSLAGPQVYWFKVPDGVVAFVWNAGRLNIEFKPPVGTLTLKSAGDVISAQLIDLCSGEKRDLKVAHANGAAQVANVPVGGWPVAVKFSTK